MKLQKIIILIACLALSWNAFSRATTSRSISQTEVEGIVTHVEVLYESYTERRTVSERTCHIEDVPVYAERYQEGDALGGALIGGLIGAFAGNKFSNQDGAGAAGAVAGAVLGHQSQQGHTENVQVGSTQREVCQNTPKIVYVPREEVSGYRITVYADGEYYTFATKDSYYVNDSIILEKQTTYRTR